MRHVSLGAIELCEVAPREMNESVVGHIVEITPDGVALVDYAKNLEGPIRARSAISALPKGDISKYRGTAVLLSFEHGDPKLPVVIGFVRDTLFPEETEWKTTLDLPRPEEAVVDGESVRLDAKEEIVLSCGKSKIIMRKDGKIVVRGVEITNRAQRTNKIKGGAVRIN